MAPDGSSLLTLDASSVQTAADGYRRIVWMIKWMIKAHPTQNRTARQAHHRHDSSPLAVLREVGLHLASPSPRLAVVDVLTCTNRNGSQGEAVGLASCFRRSGPSNGVLLGFS